MKMLIKLGPELNELINVPDTKDIDTERIFINR